MADIGSWWVKGFGARPGESVLSAYYANYLRGEGRPLGGKLYVTDERLLFCPHLIDAFFGGSRRMIQLDTISAVERFDPESQVEETTIDAPGGGTEERIRVRLVDGTDAFFIANDLDDAIADLEAALGENA